jgi:amino acid adenylation domain-containing protein
VVAENILELPSLPEAGEITMVNATPTAMAELLRAERLPASVLAANVGGEAVPRSVVDLLYSHATVVRVRNAYGPSENTSYTTLYPIARSSAHTPPLGRPIGNGRMYLLDRELEPLPVGVAGELYVGGAGLARGYLDRPELTAERFLPDPFAVRPGERMYRVGDIVRLLPDGQFEFVGRIDHQVKVRGYRIELGEIEKILLTQPGIAEAAVVIREDTPGDRRLVAYATASGETPTVGALRARLAEKLPEYMIPSGFVFLDLLPRTPSGKIDRRTLSLSGLAPEYGAPRSGELALPGTPVEELLAGIWADVLGRSRVGSHDSFFELGGHSLLAAQLVSRVRGAFGLELPLRRLFEAPTVAALAREIAALEARGVGYEAPPIERHPRGTKVPLSFAQERLWFLDRLEGDTSAYHIPAAIELVGSLDLAALAGAVAEVVRRHEALRTHFVLDGRQPVQAVSSLAGWALPVADLSALAPRHREPEVQRLSLAVARRLFDLARGPLLRTVVLRLGKDRHLLLLVIHHIVSDGWSMAILIRETAALYRSRLAGGASPLPELPVQYGDFALWQRSWLQGEVMAAGLAYWREQLRGAPPVLELPTDRPRPAVQGYRGAVRPLHLPAALSAGLGALARGETATLFMVLLAGFQILLARYSGQEDLCVGTPVAGRDRMETEGLIGLFVNTLVLRGDLSGSPTFRELLLRLREMALEAYRYQDLPFDKVVEELRPERSLSHTPLFQVMLALQNVPRETLELAGLRLTLLPIETGVAKFDLLLSLAEEPGGLSGTLEYSTDLFDAPTVERLAGHFEQILGGIVGAPEGRIAALPLLAPAERWQLLEEWNATGMEFPADLCLHQLVEAQVERTPAALAVVRGGERLTYRELNVRANRLAHSLRRLGVGPESRVGIFVERSPSLVVALLAVQKAGGAYVPLDPSYPGDRVGYMVEDARVQVIVVGAGVAEKLPEQARTPGVHLVWLGADHEELGRAQADNPESGALPQNLSYIIYTSGSTGRPKGVAIQHRSAVSMISWALAEFGPEESAVVLLATSVSFDVSVLELFFTLARGSKLVVAENILELPRLPEAGEITMVNATPTAMAELLRDERLPASVRVANVGGEPVPRSVVDKLYSHETLVRVRNASGPSENTTYTCLYPIARSSTQPPPLGRPIGNGRMYLLDRELEPLPIGVAGELYVSGPGLARGYLDRPELTAERFLPDPFAPRPGERMYRSGDIVRLLPNGQFEFVGRIDHQVKVRGYRIELGEIEAVLLTHPGIADAAVVIREDAPGDRRLVAYATVASGEAPAVGALRALLAGKLPEYMIPSGFVFLDLLPRTPSGKIDRRTLSLSGPAPEWGAPRSEELAGPSRPVEELLAGIWADVLGCSRVGSHDSFFELGGHSLLAAQLVSRVRGAFGLDLPLRRLFEAPTVAALAREIEALRAQGAGLEAPPIERRPEETRGAELPLSFAQERLWFLEQLEPGQPTYLIPAAVRLRGRLHRAALAASLSEIVRRHEAMRTRFRSTAGGEVQVVAPELALPMPSVDLATLAAGAREAELARLAQAEMLQPFDLERGPLVRIRLVRLAPEEHAALFTLHHIISDGWSVGVLLGELAALYRAAVAGEASPLPELPVQYPDFALWQRRWLQGEVLARQLDYWRQRLAGAPPVLTLPTDRPRPPLRAGRGGLSSFTLPAPLSERLKRASREAEATLFMTLLAAFQSLVSRYTGELDVSTGSPVANRNREETEKLIGFFVNMLVLRTDFAGDPTFAGLLAQVREVTLGAYAHQDLPFEQLVDALEPERSLSYTPLFQVAFALQNAAGGAISLPGLTLERLPAAAGAAKFDLTLTLAENGDGLEGEIEYDRELFDEATVARLGSHFALLLDDAAADLGRRVSRLSFLSTAERRQIAAWQAVVSAPVLPGLAPQIAAQAARTPLALAVADPEGSLTYAELDARANRLARRLLEVGGGPGELVGLCLPRSAELVVALLAVLKAGASYMPLDPNDPRERLALLLDDARPAVLVSRSDFAGRLPERHGRALWLDREDRARGGGGPGELPPPPSPEDLLYVIYTSGSTGRPKGAGVSHGGFANLLAWYTGEFGFDAADRVLLLSSFSFDLTQKNFFAPLLVGGELHLAPAHYDPAQLVATVERSGITRLNCTPSAFYPLVERGEPERLASLRSVFLGGEPIAPARLAPWLGAPGCRAEVVNTYGPTECTDVVAFHRLAAADLGSGSAPLGRPIPNARLAVLGAAFEPVPAGVAGELSIGGICPGLGYLDDPALTADRFLPDPLAGPPGQRLYRTGDLARYRPDGTLEYLGRIDHQVKVRGFRIELGEIEAVLLAHPGVRAAAVLARADVPGDPRLVAYVVPQGDAPGSAAELFRHLAAALPAYMVPASFVFLDSLPQNASGKVDRRALPPPADLGSREPAGLAAPRTPAEELLCEIWADVLGLPRVGIHDNFFGLGGHSLLAPRIVLRLRDAFGAEVPVRALFQHPTVAGLAGVVAEAQGESRDAEPPLVRSVTRGAPQPLSSAQLRFWRRRGEGRGTANSPLGARVSGPLNAAALERSLAEVVRRHEVLRSSILEIDGEPAQVVRCDAPLAMPLVDLAALPAGPRESELHHLGAQAASYPFDLAREPLVRATLVRLGSGEHAFFLAKPHLITDGWSDGVFAEELALLYPACLRGEPSPLPELPIQYADYAAWHRAYLEGEVFDQLLRYWEGRLAGLRVLPIPTDRPRPAVRSLRGGLRHLQLDGALSRRVRELGRRENASLFMTLLAAWKALLSLWSGEEDVALTTNVANRGRGEVERLIGLFTNVLALRTDLSGDPSFRQLLGRVRESTLEAFSHQELPFVEILNRLCPGRSDGYNELFPAGFVLQNFLSQPVSVPGISIEIFELSPGSAPRDLILLAAEEDGRLETFLLYREDIFAAATVDALLARYATLLETVTRDPHLPLSALAGPLGLAALRTA